MIKACIFDLDGVIVDTAKFHYLAWNRLASTLGYTISPEHNEQLKGVSRRESLQYILDLAGVAKSEEEILEMMDKKNEWYLELISDMNKKDILPGAKALLEELNEKNIPVALGSASKNAVSILKAMDIIHLFDIIIDGNKTSRSKPDPEVFQMGAKGIQVSPENCIVFEDSQSGIEAANRGGFISIGIGDAALLADADYVIADLEGITFDQLVSITNSMIK